MVKEALLYPLSIVNINGAERFSWREKDPQQRVQRCRRERDWLGGYYTKCDWFWEPDPPTYSIRTGAPRRQYPPGGSILPDMDHIEVRVAAATPGEVEIVLSLEEGLCWWKGIIASPNHQGEIVGLDTYPYRVERGLYRDDCSIAPNAGPDPRPDDLTRTEPFVMVTSRVQQAVQLYPASGGGAILLAKAKVLGFHEWVYVIPLSEFLRFDGMRVQFHWWYDYT
jgi:hypothetical protein